jgi:hypothetical protein
MQRFESRDRCADATQSAVADKNNGKSEWPIQICLSAAAGARRENAAGCFDDDGTVAVVSGVGGEFIADGEPDLLVGYFLDMLASTIDSKLEISLTLLSLLTAKCGLTGSEKSKSDLD